MSWDRTPWRDDGPKEKAFGCYSLLGEFKCGSAFPPPFSGDLTVAPRKSGAWTPRLAGFLTGPLPAGTLDSFLAHRFLNSAPPGTWARLASQESPGSHPPRDLRSHPAGQPPQPALWLRGLGGRALLGFSPSPKSFSSIGI